MNRCSHITEEQMNESIQNFVSKKYMRDGFHIFVCCRNCKFELNIPKSNTPVRICKCIVICLE